MDCTIINFDEASFRLVPIIQKIWVKRGSKPGIPFWFSSKKANIFGALIDGKEMVYDWFDKLNAKSFIEFLKKLMTKLPKKKYVFVLDNAPAHKAKITMQYLEQLGENIYIEFIPPYSPQLNCIETCWKILRHDVTSSNFFKTLEVLKKGVEQFLDNHLFTLNPSNYLSR